MKITRACIFFFIAIFLPTLIGGYRAFGAPAKKAAPQSQSPGSTITGDNQADDQDAAASLKEKIDFSWRAFPDDSCFKVLGLNWFRENQPLLLRLPKNSTGNVPKAVTERAKIPSGGRIYMKCTAAKLGLRVQAASKGGGRGFDVYINGSFYRSVSVEETGVDSDVVLYSDFDTSEKEILIYLPSQQSVLVKAVGTDEKAVFRSPEPKFKKELPIVFYGSSVCQGNGASKPGMTYEAIAARELGVDFINLGFGGAGKAEKGVVDLVNSIPACCYIFDLGKSYGMQDKQAFKVMLERVGKSHPGIPVICITPITSATEIYSKSYLERSIHTRTVMRDAAHEVIAAGASNIYIVEGEDLLGFKEHDGLSKDGVHPSDYGYHLIAQKLLPTVSRALGL
jgi:hypothetical protein